MRKFCNATKEPCGQRPEGNGGCLVLLQCHSAQNLTFGWYVDGMAYRASSVGHPRMALDAKGTFTTKKLLTHSAIFEPWPCWTVEESTHMVYSSAAKSHNGDSTGGNYDSWRPILLNASIYRISVKLPLSSSMRPCSLTSVVMTRALSVAIVVPKARSSTAKVIWYRGSAIATLNISAENLFTPTPEITWIVSLLPSFSIITWL